MAKSFPITSYLYEGIESFIGLGAREKEDIMIAACPLIERKLGDMSYLRTFERKGAQLFYDTGGSPEGSPYGGAHLKDGFSVDFDGYNFLISNAKYVRSRGGDLNLFEDLLMAPKGSVEYKVDKMYRSKQRAMMGEARYAYLSRTKKQRKTLDRKLITGNLMTFYYRFDGKMCWKRDKRRGYYEEVMTKFRSYIDGAIRYGVQAATTNQIGEDEYDEARGLISDQ